MEGLSYSDGFQPETAPLCDFVAYHVFVSPQLNERLSEVLALEEFEEGGWRVLDALHDSFLPGDLSFAHPPRHVSLELGYEIEVVRDSIALESDALANGEHDVTRTV